MTRSLLICTALGLLLAGCRKEPLPEPVPESPVFYIKCDAQGVPLRIEAGNNGYRMVPGYFYDNSGIYVLTSTLKNEGCTNCYELTVRLNDHRVSASGDPLQIDSALRGGTYLFNDKNLDPVLYKVKLSPAEKEDATGTYQWTVSCYGTSAMNFSSYNAEFTADANKSYTATLYYENAAGCGNYFTRVIRPSRVPHADIQASSTGSGDLTFQFNAVVSGGEPVSYEWDFGDGHTADGANPKHTFSQGGPAVYLTTLKVTYADQTTTTAQYQLPGTTDPMCLANFGAALEGVPNPKALSKVTFELRDPSGKVYSSRDFVQPQQSRFEVVEIQDYQDTGAGMKTRKYRAVFDCVLRDGADEMRLSSGEMVMAVGYP